MAWSDILAFIQARDEGFAQAVIPVPRDAIATVQRECGVELPEMYVEMLATLGERAAGYHPFGPTQDHDFYRLVELLPPRFHPVRDYFKVSRCTVFDVEPEEYYLDLTRAAGDDTPLVYMSLAGEFSRDHVHDLGLTLAEMLTRSAFTDFELDRKPDHARVFAHADSHEEAYPLFDRVVAHVEKMGMKVLLPAQRRLVCLGDGERAAEVEIDDESVAIELAGPDEVTVQRVVEQLLDGVPDAVQARTGPPKAD